MLPFKLGGKTYFREQEPAIYLKIKYFLKKHNYLFLWHTIYYIVGVDQKIDLLKAFQNEIFLHYLKILHSAADAQALLIF